MSRPRKVTLPARFASRPIIVFSVVDLPAPLRPISATHSPSSTRSDTPYRICAAPYQASSASTSSMAGRSAERAAAGRLAA